ncbi:MAG TPA: DUF4136 domain-containing protein [Castellaniella sp.]|uniref:DUF4136 domain-containing protein n=1 Tax=Castellaniella sp. TaxID=1955812 RepID=UPI002EFDB346
MNREFQSLCRQGSVVGRWLLSVLLILAMSGCATVFSAQVSRFEQWPQNADGASYWIKPDKAQQNNLQFQTYADAVRAALGPTGLVEASNEAQARFVVHMDYSSPRERVWEQRPVDPYYYGPGPFYRPWRWGYAPMVQNVVVDVYRMTLSVRIDDRSQQGHEVYRATAVATNGRDQLGAAMPYLARALFDHFPGRNGEVIQVRYPVR